MILYSMYCVKLTQYMLYFTLKIHDDFEVKPMTGKPSCHLLAMLASLPDPRKKKGKRHPLKVILALAIIAIMSG